MAKKKKPSLADYVEAAERREAPRAQARVTGRSGTGMAWIGVLLLTALLTAGALAFLRLRHYI